MKNLWQDCPQCGSGNVEPYNYWIVVAGVWVLAAIAYLFHATAALVVAIVALLMTIVAFIITVANYKVLKCKDCKRYWLYKEEKKDFSY